jgi:hypothetical protein
MGVPFPVEFRFGEKSYPEAGNEDMDGEIFLRREWVWGAITRRKILRYHT